MLAGIVPLQAALDNGHGEIAVSGLALLRAVALDCRDR